MSESKLKQQVQTMVGDDQEIIPNEFSNLILDELQIVRLSEADKAFLEEFTNLQSLSMNSTSLVSLENFPKAPKLQKLYLDDNKLKGADLAHLPACAENLEILFVCNNQLKELEDVEELSKLKSLKVLDLSNNEVCEKENYRDQLFEKLSSLEFLDQWNKAKDTEFVDEDEYDEEAGEEEYNELDDNIPLTEEMRQKLIEQGIDPDKYEDYDDEDFNDEYGEEEFDEEDGEEEGDDAGLGKRENEGGDQEGDAQKRTEQ